MNPQNGNNTHGAAYLISEVAALVGVSNDTVRRWIDQKRLPTVSQPGPTKIPGEALAHFLTEQSTNNPAEPAVASSPRNRLTGLVTRVQVDGVMAQVDIQVGQHRIVSIITRESAEELGLAPGVLATAVVKSTNVSLDRPSSAGKRI